MGLLKISFVVAVGAVLFVLLAAPVLTLTYDLDIDHSGDAADIEYEWRYDGSKQSLTVSIPETAVRGYEDSPIPRFGNPYALYRYVTPDDPVIRNIASVMIQRTDGLSDLKTVDYVLRFVQNSIAYAEDSGIDDYRFPLETLYAGKGDCEDSSLLFAAIVEAMGYDTVLVIQKGHCTAAVDIDADGRTVVHGDKEYVVCDPTGDRQIGYDDGKDVIIVVGRDANAVLCICALVIAIVLALFVYAFVRS